MQKLIKIQGVVKKGQSRGKKLGFPTANIDVVQSIPEGIYVSQTIVKNKRYNSLTFVGAAKTFNETKFHAESCILNFDEDIYGENVEVILLKKIRDNQRFKSEEELVKQMEEDKKEAEEWFNKQINE